jgi:hypothetical protein
VVFRVAGKVSVPVRFWVSAVVQVGLAVLARLATPPHVMFGGVVFSPEANMTTRAQANPTSAVLVWARESAGLTVEVAAKRTGVV